MRIAFLTTDFGVPLGGTKGASVHVRQLVKALCDCGHELLVLMPNVVDSAIDRVRCRVAHIPLGGLWGHVHEALTSEPACQGNRLAKDIRNLLYGSLFEAEAIELLRPFRPDVLYERYSLFGTAGLRLARRLGVPLLLEVNAPLVQEQQHQRGLSFPEVAQTCERLVFAEADHVFAVSDWLRDYVVTHGTAGDRVTVIPNAADPVLFAPREEPSQVRSRLGWDGDCVIGFVGSLKRWHGTEVLLSLLRNLGAPEARFRLLIVGDGPERGELERQATELGMTGCMHITGAVAHGEVPKYIAAMDVAVATLAASADGYFSPVKLFEYMAMARPTVAARIGQAVQIIEHGINGWLYAAGDAGQLAERVRWIAENRTAARKVGAAARQFILQHHTWQRNAERVIEVAQQVLGQRSAATSFGSQCFPDYVAGDAHGILAGGS